MNRCDRTSLQHDEVTLAATVWGDSAPTILMLHGFGDGRYVWEPFAAALSKDAGVTTMDFRGHGDSGRDPLGIYSADKFLADAENIIERFCAHPLVLIGHSLGAEIAIRLAASRPDCIKGLVLIDGGPGLALDGMTQMRTNFGSRQREFTARVEYRRLLSDWLPLADGGMLDLAAQEAVADRPDGCVGLKSDQALSRMQLPTDGAHLWTMLENLRCPGLLLRGEASAVLSRSQADAIVRRCPSLRLETVPMAGHAVMMDNPECVGVVLARFVAEIAQNERAAADAPVLS